MGMPKIFLKIRGSTFLERICGNFKKAGAFATVVVLGHKAGEYSAGIPPGCLIAVNRDYKKGQITSLWAGLKTAKKLGAEGVMLTLADHPLVRPGTYGILVKKLEENPCNIIIPSYNFKSGHPILFGGRWFESFMSAPLDKGAKEVMRGNREQVLYVNLNDPGVLKDLDTLEDYKNALKR